MQRPTSRFMGLLQEHIKVVSQMYSLTPQVEAAALMLAKALSKHGKKILLCGNGGSAADCQHIAAEFIGRFSRDREPLPALALTTDSSVLTCISNDYTFELVFERQILALCNPGDVLIAISTSGESQNIIHALNAAIKTGASTIGLLGKGGGEARKLCDVALVVPSDDTARIQEAHILLGHSICSMVESLLGFDQVQATNTGSPSSL